MDENSNGDAWRRVLETYCALMDECNKRYKTIFSIGQDKAVLPDFIAYECCYLQFRMMCELVALSCLLVHGDISSASNKLKDAYKADFIVKALEKLHNNFFPQPAVMSVDGTFTRIKSDFLTRNDLIRLYRECGTILHRGSMSGPPRHINWTGIRPHALKFQKLLESHVIALRTPPFAVHFVMNRIPTNRPAATLIAWPFSGHDV